MIDVVLREISQILFDKFSYKFAKELLVCFHELLKKHKKIKEIFTVRGAEKYNYQHEKKKKFDELS